MDNNLSYASQNRVNLCLIDDDQLFVRGIRTMFEEDRDILLKSELNPTDLINEEFLLEEELEKKFKKVATEKIKAVDIALIDLRFRGFKMSGLDLAYCVAEKHPDKKLVLLSSNVDGRCGYQALHKLQLPGYLIKGSSFPKLRRDILKVADGNICYSREIYEAIHTFRREHDLPVSLTRRQQEVLDLVVQEYTAVEIGEKLCIQPDGVNEHIKNMRRKLGVRKNTGLVREAVLRELVDLSRYKK